jgi:23S rRNA (guanosine2251-2'-O)-methyltransferase
MKQQIIYGLRPVIETIESGAYIEKIFIRKGLKSDNFAYLMKLISHHAIPFQYVPIEKLNHLTSKNHQGVVAYSSLIEYYNIEEIIPELFENGKNPFILILDEITDIRNFGSIARSAECAGVDALIIPTHGAAQINEDAMKTSAGALNYIKVCRSNSLIKTIKFLKNSGLHIFSASEKADHNIFDFDFNIPVAVIMGSEGKGISTSLINLSDNIFKIPVFGKIKSLNVSNAAAIILFEIVKQRYLSNR